MIAANLWNVFTRLGDDGMHHEAATSRPLLQSCVARLSRHARQGIVTIYTATCEKAREIYRAISAFLSSISAASLGPSYENKSQVGKIALAISAFRSEVPDLCRSPIRSEGRWASLHSIIRLAGVPPCGRALMH